MAKMVDQLMEFHESMVNLIDQVIALDGRHFYFSCHQHLTFLSQLVIYQY